MKGIVICCSRMRRVIGDNLFVFGVLENSDKLCVVKIANPYGEEYPEYELPMSFCPFCGKGIKYRKEKE